MSQFKNVNVNTLIGGGLLVLVLSSYRLLAAFCQHSWLRLGPHPQALLLRSHRMAEGSAYHPIAARQRRAGGPLFAWGCPSTSLRAR